MEFPTEFPTEFYIEFYHRLEFARALFFLGLWGYFLENSRLTKAFISFLLSLFLRFYRLALCYQALLGYLCPLHRQR